MKGYLATNFFSKFTLDGTEALAQRLEKETPLKWYVPHRNGEINDKKNNDDIITDVKIYQADAEELYSSDIIVANLDGVEIDSGVAGEIGMFAGFNRMDEKSHRLIIGYYTDMRQYGTGDNHFYINLFVKGACNCYGTVVDNEEDLFRIVNNWQQMIDLIDSCDDSRIVFTYKDTEGNISKKVVFPFAMENEGGWILKGINMDTSKHESFIFNNIIEVTGLI